MFVCVHIGCFLILIHNVRYALILIHTVLYVRFCVLIHTVCCVSILGEDICCIVIYNYYLESIAMRSTTTSSDCSGLATESCSYL